MEKWHDDGAPIPLKENILADKWYCIVQAAIRPPTFVFFVNDPKLFTDEYRRYVETQLRTNVGFPGTPLRLYWRGKSMSLASGKEGRQQPSKSAYAS